MRLADDVIKKLLERFRKVLMAPLRLSGRQMLTTCLQSCQRCALSFVRLTLFASCRSLRMKKRFWEISNDVRNSSLGFVTDFVCWSHPRRKRGLCLAPSSKISCSRWWITTWIVMSSLGCIISCVGKLGNKACGQDVEGPFRCQPPRLLNFWQDGAIRI